KSRRANEFSMHSSGRGACRDPDPMTRLRRFRRLPLFAALIAPVIALAPLDAQVTVSSAANQLFHVNDASTTISPITVTDVGGGNIKFNRDIRIIIPTGFNMTWDTSV